MTREALKTKTQDGIRGLKSTNNSATANYWLKAATLEKWAKKFRGNSKKNIQHI